MLTYEELRRSFTSFRVALSSETNVIAKIESDSFPSDEMASLEKIQMRQEQASEFFRVLTDSEDQIIGYINGTCTKHSYVTHETMESHDSEGTTLVLHSVTVKSELRRKGHATFMLKAYLEVMKEQSQINIILLLCKADLCAFYRNCGFQVVGISSVVHGQDPWFELSFDLSRSRLLKQYQIDAFTSEAFRGNPAAVMMGMKSPEWMQSMAMENNLAETAFIQPIFTTQEIQLLPNSAIYDIRWFTPAVEVALCGHATLAAATALFNYGYLNPQNRTRDDPHFIDTIYFKTLYRGILIAKLARTSNQIELSFPSQPPTQSDEVSTNQTFPFLLNGFKINSNNILFVGKSIDDLLVVVTPDEFNQIPSISSGKLNFTEISNLEARGVIVTCVGPRSHSKIYSDASPFQERYPQADFLSRFFAPKVGVNEDPVTGSAHTVLTPYWCDKLEQIELMGYQQSQRGGWVGVRLEGDRVFLTGQGVCVKETAILVS